MELTLPSVKDIEIVTQESHIITTDKVALSHIIDNTLSVVATVVIEGFPKTIVLWQGDSYTAIGDWTQKEAEDKIKELL